LDDTVCVELMATFIAEHPDLWNEDIGEQSRCGTETSRK